MSKRINISSAAPWEDIVGYSRAVRIGNLIEVTGTVAVDENGKVFGKENAEQQTKYVLQKIEKVLEKAGAKMSDVIRTRIYTTDISKWQEIGKAHKEFFKDIKPATTMVEVSRLIEPDYLVEIEVTAVVE
ncbi:MAG: RidA family protein [FCB group bacterium]|jgi:reactive intermediate/imine deaminase